MPSSPTATSPSPPSVLFHLGYRLPSAFLRASICSVRYVLLCGSTSRAHAIASFFRPAPHTNLCRTDRYTLLLPHPCVLVAAHGIGTGSIDVLLHELHLALHASSAPSSYAFIRIGSCGGVGIPAGSVVVSARTLSGRFEPALRVLVLGESRAFPAHLDDALGDSIHKKGIAKIGDACVRGDTLCAETFYLAQARRDGAFAGFSNAERTSFLEQCKKRGVVNIEMESLALAAFATKVGVKAAVVCAVLVDRLADETPTKPEEKLAAFQHRAVELVVDFVKERIKEEVGCVFDDCHSVCNGNGCVNGAVLNMSHSEET